VELLIVILNTDKIACYISVGHCTISESCILLHFVICLIVCRLFAASFPASFSILITVLHIHKLYGTIFSNI